MDIRLRPLQKALFCPISLSFSNFNPQNTQCIPAVKIFVFLDLEQKLTFFKGLRLSQTTFFIMPDKIFKNI